MGKIQNMPSLPIILKFCVIFTWSTMVNYTMAESFDWWKCMSKQTCLICKSHNGLSLEDGFELENTDRLPFPKLKDFQ